MKAWLKRWGGWILGGLVFVLSLGLVRRHVKRKLGKLRDEKQLAEATARIGELRVLRKEVASQIGNRDVEVVALDQQIEAAKRQAVSAFVGGEGLSDEELEDAYREALSS